MQDSIACKIRAVTRFFHVETVGAAEPHHQLYTVYGQNVMNEGTVRM
jgi:hypothetical protein